MSRLLAAVLGAATTAALTLSCGDSNVEPPVSPPIATTLTVTPASAALTALGDTVQFKAEVRDQHGQMMVGAQVAWWSSDPSVATVDASGLARAVDSGSATVTASSGTASGTATLAVTAVKGPDRDALVALYNSTDGPNWTNSDNWLTDVELGDWFGVRTTGGRVVDLVLANNGLNGTLPPELGYLTALRKLALESNRLSGPIPAELGNMRNLVQIFLYSNELSGPIPPQLGSLHALDQLDLADNSLTGPIPPEFGNLRSIRQLGLSSNDIGGEIPKELGNLGRLTWLTLGANRLSGPLPAELGDLGQLVSLGLHENLLTGPIPSSFGGLSSLMRLILSGNPGLTGALPPELANLARLQVLASVGTDLCAPSDPAFQSWLGGVLKAWVPLCSEGAAVYLTQAVQSRQFPVPLVAHEPALLRVFPTAVRANSASLPAVSATFFIDGAEVHAVDIPSGPGPIPLEVDEGNLERSANAVIPGEVMRPGLETVVEIDPDGILDSGLGVTKRIPESGRLRIDVRPMPVLRLTLIPFLWESDPDSAIIGLARDMATDPRGHRLMSKVNTLLPVGDVEVTVHEPVWSTSNHAGQLHNETKLILAAEGGEGHYVGMMSGQVTGAGGVASWPGRTSFAQPYDWVIAHELGHNMNLGHSPCRSNSGLDTGYPYPEGNIGAWGYDFREDGLVPPSNPDLMSYCGPQWISDYGFVHALRYRLSDEVAGRAAAFGPARASGQAVESLLVWGGVDNSGRPYLEPAFLVDARPALPDSSGSYEVSGWAEDGRRLFALSFTMPRTADAGRASSFAFAVPMDAAWAGQVARIRLSGPGGIATLDGETDRPVAIVRDPVTGRVRGVLRHLPRDAGNPLGAVTVEPGLAVLLSRGIPHPG